MNETHNGNLNRSKQPKPAMQEGMQSAGKSNGTEATLRKGNLPKAQAVRDAKYDEGAHASAAKKQYEPCGVPPQDSEHPTRVHTSGGRGK